MNNLDFNIMAALQSSLALIFELVDNFNGRKDIHLHPKLQPQDNTIFKRFLFTFSKISNLILFSFIILSILSSTKIKIHNYFMIIAPLSFAASIMYYVKIYNFKKNNFYDQEFKYFYSHFWINIFLIIKFITIGKLELVSILYFYLFFILYLILIIFNKSYRKVWPYGAISNLTKKEGLKNIIIFLVLSQIFSIKFYFLNKFLHNS